MLENHPVFHYVLALVFYNIGLLVNVLAAAHLSTSSKNNSVKTIGDYFSLRWVPLSVRGVVCNFVFLIGWENPSLKIEAILDHSLPLHLGAAGFLGFASDEFISKVLAVFGIQKELPAVPTADKAPDSGAPQ